VEAIAKEGRVCILDIEMEVRSHIHYFLVSGRAALETV